jgi:SAM-dependent methyltransferase
MQKTFVMYKNEKVNRTLEEKFMTSFLKNAQKTEFKELKNIIEKVYSETKKPLMMLDIGIGNGRIFSLLSKEPIWKKIRLYVGFDNSKVEIKKSRNLIGKRKFGDKVKVVYFDAINLNKRSSNEIFRHKYDLIICTYFTADDFKPDEIEIKTDKNGLIASYPKIFLEPNKKFVKIFKGAYKLLKHNGKIVLGSIYIDNDINRIRQEEFYKKCGMTVITTKNDSFTATKEGFWSQRFTKDKIYDYFSWLNKGKIKFIQLDNYNFAQMVIISK